jgi:hypothetical protein
MNGPTRRKSVNKKLITPKLRALVNLVNEELGPVCVEQIIDLRPNRPLPPMKRRFR